MKIKLEARFKTLPMTIENPDLYLDNQMIGVNEDKLTNCLPEGYTFNGLVIVDPEGKRVFSVLTGEDYVWIEYTRFNLFLKVDDGEWKKIELED